MTTNPLMAPHYWQAAEAHPEARIRGQHMPPELCAVQGVSQAGHHQQHAMSGYHRWEEECARDHRHWRRVCWSGAGAR